MKKLITKITLITGATAAVLSILLVGVIFFAAIISFGKHTAVSETRTIVYAYDVSQSTETFRTFANVNCRIRYVDSSSVVMFDSMHPSSVGGRDTETLFLPENGDVYIRRSGVNFICTMATADGGFVVVTMLTGLDGSLAAPIILAFVAICIFCAMAGTVVSRMASARFCRNVGEIVANYCSGAPAHPMYDELIPLIDTVESERTRLRGELQLFREQRARFNAIIYAARDGILVGDGHGHVIAVNPCFREIVGIPDDVGDEDIVSYLRKSSFLEAFVTAFDSGCPYRADLTLGDRVLDISMSSLPRDSGSYGVIIIAADITESRRAQQFARELTINITHDLKTPLTSIMGYAELIANGVASGDDVFTFSDKVVDESTRMLALINETLRLARMNESAIRSEFCPVTLTSVASDCANSVEFIAASRGISVSWSGEPVQILGNRTLIFELLENLTDNAIRYNQPGGSVEIEVRREDKYVVLEVRDTGFGIPADIRERVFDRFYRLDMGGTASAGFGLGLAMVRLVAMRHEASLELDDLPSGGTVARVRFHAIPPDGI